MHDRNMVFRAIVKFKVEHDGNSPTMRELCAQTGITSTSVLAFALRDLERKGLLRPHHLTRYAPYESVARSRNIEVVGGRWILEGLNEGEQDAEAGKEKELEKEKSPKRERPAKKKRGKGR